MSEQPGRADRLSQAMTSVDRTIERSADRYPADLPPDHLSRRARWHSGPRWDGPDILRRGRPDFSVLGPLSRALESERCHAEAVLVAELLGDLILNTAERDETIRRSLGILPGVEEARFREICTCPELRPRCIYSSALRVVEAVKQVETEFGCGTALAYGMLIVAGVRSEGDLVKYGCKLDGLFSQVTSAPDVDAMLRAEVPVDPDERFDILFTLLHAARETLWRLKPARVSQEFLFTRLLDNYLGPETGAGNSLGLALLDAVVVAKLGFPVTFLVNEGVMRLEVRVGNEDIHWEVAEKAPLDYVPVVASRRLGLSELFAVVYGSIATLYFSRGMWDKAGAYYEHVLELQPESVETLTSLGICHLRREQPAEALGVIKKALDLKPDAPEALCHLGNAHAMKEDWPRAINAYKRAIRIRPDYVEAFNNLGFAYMRRHDMSQAAAAFEAAIEARPGYHEAHYNLGNLYLEQQQYDKAVRCFREAVRIEPGFVPAYCNMGRACYEKQDLDGAIHCYQKALQLNPKHFGAWHNLGIAYRDKGLTQKAVEALEKAVTINPNLMR